MPTSRLHHTPYGRQRLVAALMAAALVGLLPMAMTTATSPRPMTLDGCNEQLLGDSGHELRWTSAFRDGSYPGVGTELEVTVQYSVHDEATGDLVDVPIAMTALGFRGAGFTPSGVSGHYVDTDATPTAAPIPPPLSLGGLDCPTSGVANHTFTFTFDSLHAPARRSALEVATGVVTHATRPRRTAADFLASRAWWRGPIPTACCT